MAVSLMQQAREAARQLQESGKAPFGSADLADLMGIQDYAGKKKVWKDIIPALLKSGELERVSPGKYRCFVKAQRPEKRRTMWAVLRARRTVHVEDLMEMADSSREMVLQFLRPLVRQQTVQKVGQDVYRLAEDPGPAAPRDSAKCDRLRNWREKQKAVLNKVDLIFGEVAELRLMVSQLGEQE